MGMPFSRPLDDLDNRVESYLVRTISFGSDGVKATVQSINLSDGDPESSMLKSLGSGKVILEGSLSFKGSELETKISLVSPVFQNKEMVKSDAITCEKLPTPDSPKFLPPNTSNQRNLAALKLQKTYKSFRTRRQLADCAVLVEQRWWKLLDSVELKNNSVSFFDIEKPETAVSRWSRASAKAAKVGKGLSKDEKARKLALQHWLEAIDPRHRYGHNLQFYYAKWLQCKSRQPFFYWLDIGEGKEVNLERCSRYKLHQQCIKYLGPVERQAYEVTVVDGKFMYKKSGKLLNTTQGPKDAKWIFVLSVSRVLYVGMKHKGTFQHSSFLAGGATLSAGRLVVKDGTLKAVWPHSGHYLPTEENFEEFLSFLEDHSVDVSVVQKAPSDEDEEAFTMKEKSLSLQKQSSENASSKKYSEDNAENRDAPKSRLRPNIARLEIPNREDILKLFLRQPAAKTPSDGYITAEEDFPEDAADFSVAKPNLFRGENEEDYEEPVPEEKIIRRLNSQRGMKSYQLAHRLSCKWTTGAGPRIGCMRDYPLELQNRVLEEAQLSPKSAHFPARRSAHSTASSLIRSPVAWNSPLAPKPRTPLVLSQREANIIPSI
ncbi:PREDICTED: IQ domain-containing protein IQM6-like [Ipomoea nil]|uniref:IQ domain-containing protein IQM6-like n=1 Tax=Ipomoea nil TaxID=35883 RepID=UPI000901DAA1|nr:PREDICTED: IQ domain-containing protein IQM6-like [Ipomoea nil]